MNKNIVLKCLLAIMAGALGGHFLALREYTATAIIFYAWVYFISMHQDQ